MIRISFLAVSVLVAVTVSATEVGTAQRSR